MRYFRVCVVTVTLVVLAACAPPGGGPPPVPIGTLTLASIATDGTRGEGYSRQASISGDGRVVAFSSGNSATGAW